MKTKKVSQSFNIPSDKLKLNYFLNKYEMGAIHLCNKLINRPVRCRLQNNPMCKIMEHNGYSYMDFVSIK